VRKSFIKWGWRLLLGLIAVAMVAVFLLAWDGLHDRLGKADAALVLGSKVELNGIPSPRLQARLDKAVKLYREGYFPVIIVSGGTGKEGYDEATVMRSYLLSSGIPWDRIVTDSHGVTTQATAADTARILHERHGESVLVISQYFHLPRCRMALFNNGVKQVYSAHADFFELRDAYSLLRELPACIKYGFLRGTNASLVQDGSN
jgi:vancomycin permeability regulator SanA